MEGPEKEIVSVVLDLSCSSPEVQKAAVQKYMTRNVAYRHPLCCVGPGSDSRARVLAMYQCVRSPLGSDFGLVGSGRRNCHPERRQRDPPTVLIARPPGMSADPVLFC